MRGLTLDNSLPCVPKVIYLAIWLPAYSLKLMPFDTPYQPLLLSVGGHNETHLDRTTD